MNIHYFVLIDQLRLLFTLSVVDGLFRNFDCLFSYIYHNKMNEGK